LIFIQKARREQMKKTVTLKIALTLASAFLAGAASWAGGAPGGMGMGTFSDDSVPGAGNMGGMGMNPVPGNMGMMNNTGGFNPMMSGGFSMPVDPNSLANNYSNMGGSYPGGMGGYPSGGMNGGGGMPMLDLRQVVQQGIQRLPQAQRSNGAMNMANQNLSQLSQGMGNGMSPINQIRNSVRDSIMMNRVSDISRMGQATFRPMVQPGAVQSMISQIQPWNFPYRFQSAMMPAMIPMVSAPIKQNQMAYMQAGIMNNPNFPNVPLPMPAFGSSSSGSGYYDPYNGMMPGNQGMYGGGYSNGMMPMQNMMMPNMQNMMMQNMMQGMMPMM
jgi:hypothetical protein